jgi:phosphatidate cytidylyltransferase
MMTRILTGISLLALLLFALWMGGWVFSILWIACVLLAMAEEFHLLSGAGHRPVAWPTWLALIVSIPCFLLFDENSALPILMAMVFLTFCIVCASVLFRSEPRIEDMLMSLLPLLSIALPGMFMLAMGRLPEQMSRLLLTITFFVPVIGDTSAYFVGTRYGRVKLIPLISPKKTVEGALGGLLGSMLTSLGLYLIALTTGMTLPVVWHFVLIGLLGGVIGQLGDLFASIVKRHCNAKDFGTIFPGHGGMMDRLDSILFVAVFVYIYYLLML